VLDLARIAPLLIRISALEEVYDAAG
jgi:hypothetical protein